MDGRARREATAADAPAPYLPALSVESDLARVDGWARWIASPRLRSIHRGSGAHVRPRPRPARACMVYRSSYHYGREERPDLCRVGGRARTGGPGRSSTRRRGRSGNKWLAGPAGERGRGGHVPAAAAVSGAKRNVPTCRRARTSDVIGRACTLARARCVHGRAWARTGTCHSCRQTPLSACALA